MIDAHFMPPIIGIPIPLFNRSSDSGFVLPPENQCMTAIGDKIREARERRGLTQAQLAAIARVSQGTLSDIESGVTKDPRCSAVMKLSAALGLPVERVLDDSDGLNEEEQEEAEALFLFRAVPGHQRATALTFLKGLIEAARSAEHPTTSGVSGGMAGGETSSRENKNQPESEARWNSISQRSFKPRQRKPSEAVRKAEIRPSGGTAVKKTAKGRKQ
jgi:transcriptional regulator with XRE-family HTH domain